MSAAALLASLADEAVPGRAASMRDYLTVDLDHLGVPVPTVRRAVRAHLPEHADVRDLALDLWAHPVFEARLAAVMALTAREAELGPADVPLLERLLRDAGTWALVDPFAIDVVGPLAARSAALGPVLDRWVTDDDVWVRRAALLALLLPLRAGGGDWERFGRYADALLADRSPWIRKAIGWVLRDTGRRRPELVGPWLLPRAHRTAGVTVREAVRHLPQPLRAEVLAAHRTGAAQQTH